MAQSGFTPILIYGSGTTGNTPAAGNLTTSASGVELALNYFDGKLFYKDNAGAVQVLAVKMPSGVLPIANGGTNATATPTAGAVAYGTGTAYAFTAVGTAGQPLLSNAGSAPAFGTLGVAGGGTGLTSLTANRIPYGAGTSAFANSANLTFDGSTLTVNTVAVGLGGGSVAGNIAVGLNTLFSNTTGDRNTVIGYQAAFCNTTSSNTTAIGWRALFNNTAANNSAVGQGALLANTTGAGNTAMGSAALICNTTASNNSAFGVNALVTNSIGQNNTGVGEGSLFGNTTGSGNTAVGQGSARTNTTGGGLTAVGAEALRNSSTGSFNTAIGNSSLACNTTASDNTAVGYTALFLNTTGAQNTAVGRNALYSNTTANNNTAVGFQAATCNTTGSNNVVIGVSANAAGNAGNSVIIGYEAGRSATGTSNTLVGWQSGYSLTSGIQNTAFGLESLKCNTTGSLNSALGFQALFSNTTANNNTAVGYQAAFGNTTGTGNTSIGYRASCSNTTGLENTSIGFNSLQGNTTGIANTAIGATSLSSLTTGSCNTAIGHSSGNAITTGACNTIVGRYTGNQGGLDIRTSNNNIVLSDGDGNPRLYINSSGNVGINTTIAYHFLQVNGAASAANTISIAAAFKQNGANSDAITAIGLGVENASFVKGGIGWQRVGANYDTGSLIFYNRSTADTSSFTSSDARLVINSSGQILVTGSGTAALPIISKSDDTNTGIFFPAADTVAVSTNGSERVRVDSSGNVVITGSGGLGYGTGSGGAVTQATSRTTGVTLNKTNGQITLVSAAGTATWQSFTVTNSTVAATDVVIVNQDSGTDLYQIFVTNVAAGSFRITFATTGGTTTEQPVFGFAVIKAVTA